MSKTPNIRRGSPKIRRTGENFPYLEPALQRKKFGCVVQMGEFRALSRFPPRFVHFISGNLPMSARSDTCV